MSEEIAIVAGGCFWCIEAAFIDLPGVSEVYSGYIGGNDPSPTYEKICTGNSGHYEAVKVIFNREEITYEQILTQFWKQIDPTDNGGQFADRGSQYKTAIFCLNEFQVEVAEKSKQELTDSGIFVDEIATEIISAENMPFYEAEDYHQGYCKTNPVHYQMYKQGSGRADFIDRVWSQ